MTRSARPPSRLPPGLHDLWSALERARKAHPTRAHLARALGVSTHTLQRILVDGEVPRFRRGASTRQTLAWARTLARLADRLGGERKAWIEGAGIRWTEQVERASEEGGERSAWRRPVETRSGSLREPEGFARSIARELMRAMAEVQTPNPAEHSAHCQSCSQPLRPDSDLSPEYCRFCSDDAGRLRTREEVHGLIAQWMESWQPQLTPEEARRRATLYMSAMPAWSERSLERGS